MTQHSERFLEFVAKAKVHTQEIDAKNLQTQIANGDSIMLFDVREDHEWARGHIITATHLGKGVIERDIEKHTQDSDQKIVLYCGGGYRSALAAKSLQQMGYNNIKSLAGGYRNWLELNLPIDNS